jgi:hypothetical protein
MRGNSWTPSSNRCRLILASDGSIAQRSRYQARPGERGHVVGLVVRRFRQRTSGWRRRRRAGLRDGLRAATHWHKTRPLARGYPAIEVEPEAIYVEDGQVFSSAGITAGIDPCPGSGRGSSSRRSSGLLFTTAVGRRPRPENTAQGAVIQTEGACWSWCTLRALICVIEDHRLLSRQWCR